MLTDKLKELRLAFNFKQSDLANKLSISTSRYGQYERGERTPDYKMLIKIADIYNVSLDYLLDRQFEKSEEDVLLAKKIRNADDETKSHIEQFLNFLLQQKQEDVKKKIAK